jgi:hypothetical protein
MNKIKEILTKRGHSDPEDGAKKIKVKSLDWDDEVKNMTPEQFIERIKNGDQQLKYRVESRVEDELEEANQEAYHWSQVQGGYENVEINWNSMGISGPYVTITGKGKGWTRDDDYVEFTYTWKGDWDPQTGSFFEFNIEND